jgi:hypothetical protein
MLALGWPTTEVDAVARQSGMRSQDGRGQRTSRAQGLIGQASGHHDQVGDIIGTGEEATALWREPTVKLQ